jgi:signal transduction histidine kinase
MAVTDVMAWRAQQLGQVALTGHDPHRLAWLDGRIENWSRASDYVAVGVTTLVVAGSVVAVAGMYRHVFRPLFDLSASMKRFTAGDRDARAQTSHGVELASAAENFNEMADIITGQHARMLRFLEGAARELKNPVHVMKMSLQEFGPNRPLPNEQMIRQRLAIQSRELDRLDRMVDNYLDAGGVEWKRLDLQLGRQDLRPLVEEVTEMYDRFSDVHRVTLSVPQQPVRVLGNPDRLTQVVHTLISNAIGFSPRGGVVEVALCVQGKEAILRVTDHGIGIGEGELPTIFEPFQKLSGVHREAPGASVALSVAQRIVHAHRGNIDVTSKVGEGSTFRVHLPLADESPAKEEAAVGRAVARDGRSAPSAPQPSGHA